MVFFLVLRLPMKDVPGRLCRLPSVRSYDAGDGKRPAAEHVGFSDRLPGMSETAGGRRFKGSVQALSRLKPQGGAFIVCSIGAAACCRSWCVLGCPWRQMAEAWQRGNVKIVSKRRAASVLLPAAAGRSWQKTSSAGRFCCRQSQESGWLGADPCPAEPNAAREAPRIRMKDTMQGTMARQLPRRKPCLSAAARRTVCFSARYHGKRAVYDGAQRVLCKDCAGRL